MIFCPSSNFHSCLWTEGQNLALYVSNKVPECLKLPEQKVVEDALATHIDYIKCPWFWANIAFAMSECVRAMKTEFQGASTNYENKAQSDSDFELELNRCILLGRGFYTQNEGNGGMWVR